MRRNAATKLTEGFDEMFEIFCLTVRGRTATLKNKIAKFFTILCANSDSWSFFLKVPLFSPAGTLPADLDGPKGRSFLFLQILSRRAGVCAFLRLSKLLRGYGHNVSSNHTAAKLLYCCILPPVTAASEAWSMKFTTQSPL